MQDILGDLGWEVKSNIRAFYREALHPFLYRAKIINENMKGREKTITIYKGPKGPVNISVDAVEQTIWASQYDIARIFAIDQSVVSRHVRNVFRDSEVDRKSNMQKMHIANSDKPTTIYSLDVILSVGYRTNSSRAISFRIWANRILKQYIRKGYAINKQLVRKNYRLFQNAVDDVKKLLPKSDDDLRTGVIEIITTFADTWLSLTAYDRSELPDKGETARKVDITAEELENAIEQLKGDLGRKDLASELFGRERTKDAVHGIVRSIYQGFDGKDVYSTVEEKAANLLYLIVKNHPFIDGNKRIGAFSFLWFLKKAKLLNVFKLTPEVITTLTIMAAQSKMEEKDRVVGLVLMLLRR
jgi:prophage maintenance system killer protein